MKNNYTRYTLVALIIITALLLSTQPTQAQWTQAQSFSIGKVNAISSKGSTVFAGTDTGGVYISTDFGYSWTEKNVGLSNKNVSSVIIKDTVVILGVSGFGAAVFVSKDQGDTWDVPTSPYSGYLFCMVEQGNNLLAGTWFGVAKSTDNGDTWATLPTTGLPSNASVTALFAKGDTIFAGVSSSSVGGEGIFRSTDNGTTWVNKSTGITNTNFTSIAQSGNKLIAAVSGGEGVYISTNNGDSWTVANNGLSGLGVNALFVSGSNILVGTQNGIFLSKDTASSWVAINAGLPTNTSVTSVATNGHFLLIGTDSTVWRRPTAEVITSVPSVENYRVSIYPNPSRGVFTIELLDETEAQAISITNAVGQVVYTSSIITNDPLKLNLENTSQGVYSIQIKTTKGLINHRIILE